ncbi:MAG: hypothetical protein R3C49_20785 [Planctomycetaceae bacterium]
MIGSVLTSPYLQPLYRAADEQLAESGVLSNSILLGISARRRCGNGFRYTSVTDGDSQLAQTMACQLADVMRSMRHDLKGRVRRRWRRL